MSSEMSDSSSFDDDEPIADPADTADTADTADSVEFAARVSEFRALRGYQRDRSFMNVEREIRRLQALQAAMVTEVTASLSFVDDAHLSPCAWVQAVTNSSKSSALHRTHVARLLSELPLLATSVAAGQVGDDQLKLFVRLHTNPRCGHLLGGSELLLLGFAKSLRLHEFRVACQRWEAHHDPDGAHRDHELSRENRSLRSITHGAGHELFAQGDALTGDILREIIDQHAAAELENDLAWRLATYGDQAVQFPLPRTSAHRRYDAFVAVMLKGAGRDNGVPREPLINIFTNEATFNYAIRNYFSSISNVVGEPAGLGIACCAERLWLCQTASGAPVDPHDLVVAALLGRVRRVVTDDAGRVINLGRSSRFFTGAAREAVLLSGDRCCWPRCEQRGEFLQIDHLRPFNGPAGGRGGGETNANNGGPMCGPHNRAKHGGRFTVKRDQTGWHHYRPDGTEIAPRE